MLKKFLLGMGVVVLFMTIVLTACHPTPKNESVIGKNVDSITEQSKKNKIADSGSPFDTLKNWKEQINHSGKSLNIVVDANIIVPNVADYPVMEIKPETFTENQIRDLLSYFIKDDIDKLYSASFSLTKAQLEEMIIEAKHNLSKVSDPNAGLPTETELLEYIAGLEKQYANAPEANNQKFVPIKLEKVAESQYETFNAFCDLGKKKPANILVMNGNKDDFSSIFCFDNGALYSPNVELYEKQAERLSITREDATKEVEKHIANMGFTDMRIAKVETGENWDSQTNDKRFEQGYQVTCVRWVNGIPVLPFERFSEVKYENDYIAKWYDQQMLFAVDDSGLTSFRWLNYGKVYETIVESSELLPFEKIQEIFRKNIYMKNASLDENMTKYIENQDSSYEGHQDTISFKVVVDSIQLGYITQPQKNKPGQFMLVPAWFFYGYNEQTMSDGSIYKNYLASGTSSCQMIINALDGTFVE